MKFNNSKDKDSSNMKKFEDKNFRGIVFSKEKFLFGVGLVMMVFSSCISVFAASFLYNSNEVSFNNSSSPSISSNNVQGAIDELYSAASDYSALQTRVAALEGRWGAGTSNVNSSWLRITNSGSAQRGVALYDGSGTYKSGLYYDPDGDKTTLDARGTSGNYGQGKLDLRGNPVMVNGTEVAHKPTVTQLLAQTNIPTTVTSYSCNWSGYDFLIIEARQYSNIMDSITVPVSYFSTTSDGRRPYVHNTHHNKKYQVFKNGNSAVYLKAEQSEDSTTGVVIYGIKF